MEKRTKLFLGIGGALILVGVFALPKPCATAWLRWGITVDQCPIGTPVPSASVIFGRLGRHSQVTARVSLSANASTGAPNAASAHPTGRFDLRFELVGADGAVQPIPSRCRRLGKSRGCRLDVPAVPDGEHTVLTHIDSPLGATTLRTTVPLFRAAVVHIATDRPLYQPGQVIQYRSVALDRSDHTPLDGRPGVFEVYNQDEALIYSEPLQSGVFAVASGRFPLPASTEPGIYTLKYRSGQAVDSVTVRVEPFSLPRVEVDLQPTLPWVGTGEQPSVRGTVRYRSGTPVQGAQVYIHALTSGDWPLPTDWTDGATILSDAHGGFSWTPSAVPDDLDDRVVVPVMMVVTDPAGERVEAGTTLYLSSSPIVALLQSELGDGLVADFPNRVFLRLTTPDGQPLQDVDLEVKRAWDPKDPGVRATTDADAVAVLTIDPGKPGSVIVPPPPRRVAPAAEQRHVHRGSIEDLRGRPISMDDRVVLDAWTPALEPCAIPSVEASTRSYGVLVEPDGRVERVIHDLDEPVDRCVFAVLSGLRGPTGGRRFFRASWRFELRRGARLVATHRGVSEVPETLSAQLQTAALSARACALERTEASTFPSALHWQVEQGERGIETRWESAWVPASPWSAGEVACVRQAFQGVTLDQPALSAAEGVTSLRVLPDPVGDPTARSSTVTTAWELIIHASHGGEDLGTTRLVVPPGKIPDLRLRPASSVLMPGNELLIHALRGPGYSWGLPDEDGPVPLLQAGREVAELRYHAADRTISGQIPAGLHGLLTVAMGQTLTRLYVPDPRPLGVELRSDAPSYRPGELAQLTVTTHEGDSPTSAAVTLAGVDASLAELASLLEPDDWSRITVRAETEQAAFGRFDARGLLGGRIRGEHAVQATLQRISWVPTELEDESYGQADSAQSFDPSPAMDESFYGLLLDARRAVARWEQEAPAGALLTPARMAAIWGETLEARQAASEPVNDAYGVPLELVRLPLAYLELLDPYRMATDARRLSEDVESWTAWVAEEAG